MNAYVVIPIVKDVGEEPEFSQLGAWSDVDGIDSLVEATIGVINSLQDTDWNTKIQEIRVERHSYRGGKVDWDVDDITTEILKQELSQRTEHERHSGAS